MDLNNDKNRWDYIEKYFLGYNVINNESFENLGQSSISLGKMIDYERSISAASYKNWDDASMLFENSVLKIINEFRNSSIPMPTYFRTKLRGNFVSEDPIMS